MTFARCDAAPEPKKVGISRILWPAAKVKKKEVQIARAVDVLFDFLIFNYLVHVQVLNRKDMGDLSEGEQQTIQVSFNSE